MNNLELEKLANEIRKSIVTAVHSAKSGHPGGSLSSGQIFYIYSNPTSANFLVSHNITTILANFL